MIRHARSSDISRIAEIIVFGKRVAYRSIFRNDIGSFHDLQVLDLIESYQASPDIFDHMLVYDDGIIKGVINQKDAADGRELCEFYVEPFFKGKGIGRELIQFFIEEAKKQEKRKLYLWVIKDNLPARRFYEKNGFHASGEERLIEGTDVLDMRYEREL
ncbi:MAG: GNAT family N-acetyltransferase [Lachnospiraceae bacterium]|nr:GNAT family N-acetyltransferase [Lachnospiraceae bacterium]